MNHTQKLAETVRLILLGVVTYLALSGIYRMVVDDPEPDPYRVTTYCSGHDKVYIADNGSFEVLPASIDCTKEVDGG